RVGLRKVTPQFAGRWMNVLRQDAESVSTLEEVGEQLARIVSLAEQQQSIDVPELADEERRLRRPEIIVLGVAHDVTVAIQNVADGAAGAHEPFVVGRQKSEL